MRNTAISRTEILVPLKDFTKNNISKCAVLGFAIALIVGIGGLIVAGIGGGGLFHAGALSSLGQVNSVIMIIVGGAGGIPCLVIGIVGFVNCCSHGILSSTRQEEKKKTQQAGNKAQEVKLQTNSVEEGKRAQASNITEQKHIASSDMPILKNGVKLTQQPPMHALPVDVINYIFQFLTLKELATVSLVCKYWKLRSESNVIWKRLFIAMFGELDQSEEAFEYTKSEYKKYKTGFFENPQAILSERETSIMNVAFGKDSVISLGYGGEVVIWYPDKELCMTKRHRLSYSCVAVENNTMALCSFAGYGSFEIEVFKIQEEPNGVMVIDQHPFFHREYPEALRCVALHGDLVAFAASKCVQVWDCKTKKLQHEFIAHGNVREIVIQNDSIACLSTTVEVFSLKTDENLHVFSEPDENLHVFSEPEIYVGICDNKVICFDAYKFPWFSADNTYRISSYSLESQKKESLWTFPSKEIQKNSSDLIKIIIYNNLLIILSKCFVFPHSFYNINVYALKNGVHLKEFSLESKWETVDMKMQGKNLIVCGWQERDGDIKIWKFVPQQ